MALFVRRGITLSRLLEGLGEGGVGWAQSREPGGRACLAFQVLSYWFRNDSRGRVSVGAIEVREWWRGG